MAVVHQIDPGAAIGWPSLKHGGLLIAPARLAPLAELPVPAMTMWLADRLRRDVTNLLAARTDAERKQRTAALVETVLERVLELPKWTAGTNVGPGWQHRSATGDTVRPSRVWQGVAGAELCVFQIDAAKGRLGVGSSRRDLARVVEWLRRAGRSIALVTNGRQWRLQHAGADYEAFCEWDIELWFAEGQPAPQVTALRTLLGAPALTPAKTGGASALLLAIAESRKGHNDLSSALGERVRQAVETLIAASATSLDNVDAAGGVARADLYRAAVRMVMRCVVVLFAEARDLLPRSDPAYHENYGLQGLRESLERLAGPRAKDRLRNAHQAWPRIVALMRLVYFGSAHQWMPIARYGGELFRPGDPKSADPILRAVAAFEDTGHGPSDADVQQLLELLCLTKVRVRQGKTTVLATVPVDFSDLSSEYIGILYEGLLDFELRRADDLTLFLAVGNQPALPFARLDEMSEAALKDLFGKLKAKQDSADEDEAAEDTEEPTEGADEETDDGEGEDLPDDDTSADAVVDDKLRDRLLVAEWARKAVLAAGLCRPFRRKPNPKFGENERLEREYEAKVAAASRQLVARVVHPGDWYLVRWGGTRKGAGTFYTRPQLAGPTVRRTLQPLAYAAVQTDIDQSTGLARVGAWAPRTPEQILALKVCDPAMGSGSFLVSALRYLTDALWESLYAHGRLDGDAERTVARLADGLPSHHPGQQTIPLAKDHPDFDARLRALLRRHVVERCLYGVDLDPLAVELGKLALWVETMDPRLPFGFLDHKLRCGNALVGCWFDRFRAYPHGAWLREGGDKGHSTAVHYAKDTWTKAIAARRKVVAKQSTGQLLLFGNRATPEAVHDKAMAGLRSLHELPVHEQEERAEQFRTLQEDPDFQRLQLAFDTWCALWFWPADQLALAPTPADFLSPLPEATAVVRELAAKWRFLHWELAFPDVFDKPGAGFDAVVGNPPWETLQPNSKEFFSNLDPLFRALGKQDALKRQAELFADIAIERDWLDFCAGFSNLGNWLKQCGIAAVDGRGYSDPGHPFRHQGEGKPYTYKMFLELGHALLRVGGSLGFVVPSGIYSDKGTTDLRSLFLDNCQWLWLFGFENRDKVFDIHRSFKFCPIIVQKGGRTQAVRAAFMRHNVDDWADAEPHVLAYPRERVVQFSPKSRSLLEVRDPRDLAVLEKMYANGVLLGDDGPDGWGIQYRQGDFNMTSDSKLFPPRPQWEAKGYRADEYGHWLKGAWQQWHGPQSILQRPEGLVLSADGTAAVRVEEVEDVALPLYEGRMIGQFDYSEKGWVSGKGRTAVWTDFNWTDKLVQPQFCMSSKVFRENSTVSSAQLRLGYMDVSSATNQRTMVAAVLNNAPCGNKVPLLLTPMSTTTSPFSLAAVLNSYAYDGQFRHRLGGITLNYFIVEESAIPKVPSSIEELARRLTAPALRYAAAWPVLATPRSGWRRQWAITPHERLRLRCILDAAVAELYGLDLADFAWILRDCDHPVAQVTNQAFARTLDPKGFWRVDKALEPELRHTVLSLVAFHELKRIGLEAFLALHDGEGWMLPETLRLADYGLGHDDRAQVAQPVASRLGPRFLDWQLNEDVAASWDECRRHAGLIERILAVGQVEGDVVPALTANRGGGTTASGPTDLFGQAVEVDLFGNPVAHKVRR